MYAGLANSTRASLVKYSASGTRTWAADLGYGVHAIAVDAQGNPIALGRVGTDNDAVWAVTKLAAATGAIAWRRTRTEPNSRPLAVAVDTAGNAVVTGSVPGLPGGGDNAAVTMKYAAADVPSAVRRERGLSGCARGRAALVGSGLRLGQQARLDHERRGRPAPGVMPDVG